MLFEPNDPGPINLSHQQRVDRRFDILTGETEKVKYKAIELVNKLKEEKNVITKGNLKKLHELARNNSLPIEYEKPVVKEGWVGKSKGMLQI